MNDIDRNAKIIWEYMRMHHELKPANALLVLGSNDLRVPGRAAELYQAGLAPYVICSGGNGKASDFSLTEAEVFAQILKENDVPEHSISKEDRSTNTGENIQFTRKFLKEKGLDFTTFIIVTKPYMERRAYATVRKQWPEVECVVTSPQITYEEYTIDPVFKERFLHIMVGDLYRIREYPAKGFQIPQEIPPEVWTAFESLVDAGYTKYVSP